ncbi:MAG: S8 family serine peptidase [Burkholderiales bacterium]|nr:S8 family serine peptidase [Burkholderiales bacterium]
MKRVSLGFAAVSLAVASMLGASGNAAAASVEQVVVAFKPNQDGAVRSWLARQGARTVHDLGEVHAVSVRLAPRALEALRRHPGVAWVEPDYEVRLMRTARQAATKMAPAVAGETVPYGIPMVQADQVPDAAAGNRTVCIIDSGYELGHEDLPMAGVTGTNLSDAGNWFDDQQQHGTHVAGTIAALGGNGVGVVGVLPSGTVQLNIQKVFGSSGSTSNSTVARAGLNCVRDGANIISMSLGGPSSSRLQELVFRLAELRGVLSIAAAGNAGDNTISYPAGLPSVVSVAAVTEAGTHASFSQYNATVELAAPGDLVLSTVPMGTALVSDTSVSGAPYESLPMDGSPLASATAALYDFGLGDADDPGVAGKVCLIQRGIISFAEKVQRCESNGGVAAVIYNNVPGMFAGTLNGAPTGIPSVSVSDSSGAAMLGQLGSSASVTVAGGNYAFFSGTSMATPHVSGVAALVWSQHPQCSAAQIRATLRLSAMDLGPGGRDDEFGHGLVQAKAAVDRITTNGCGL